MKKQSDAVRFWGFLLGMILIGLGIVGFYPSEGMVLGLFRVNLWLNLFHILTGIFACLIGFFKIEVVHLYFQIFGVAYGILAALGFVYGMQDMIGMFANNRFDSWLHVVIATSGLILGYGSNDHEGKK